MHIQHGNPRNASQPSISTFRQFLPPCAACSPHASETPGTDADASRQTAFGTLRHLLARKTDIEKRITESIEGLERAMHTTSREFQVVLASRAELLTTTAAAAAATTASAGPTAVIVKP
ncbi:hypothetical protein D6C87_04054 [Aureobasidium pullulans]|uniref:Uncharacterized protein n=1 Tax=Aureobasidium pullulans TaxID=5580 RepID=A0AB38M1Y8_AURPU|nr:hypothetical protein D6C94_03586 [Aureobasidium pullulans]THZ43787.1 hypothetical protein D6C87_04054 [Aureobasidium pullulans]